MLNERYLVKKKLGQGRSAVYLCRDAEFPGKDIAIKILSPDALPEEVQVFRNEYFILRKLNHPNIIKPNELGTIVKKSESEKEISTGSRFITMEFFGGVELLKYQKLKDEKALIEIIKQLCSVLYYLHQSNYIYYDLKPENILVDEINGKPEIKLIDLGFAQYIPDLESRTVRGTAEYIAPELLRNEEHDHRVDFYSLGMLLYRIIFDSFPFDTKNEIEIYKSHLEVEFDFPPSVSSEKLINAVKKLLSKEPEKRFLNALQVLDALGIKIDESLTQDWMPAAAFSGRKDVLTILSTYLADEQSGEVFVIKGSEGAGKTALINEIYSKHENVIIIPDDKSKTGREFVKLLLKRIIYSGCVYPHISSEESERIENLASDLPDNLIDELKSILNKITAQCKFIMLLDGFNFYDDFTLEVLKNIFPILQVNGIKIILTENADEVSKSVMINNIREINLTPFTNIQLDEFVMRSLYPLFPREELKKIILQYADLLPGNITGFIKDIILLKIVQFDSGNVKIISDEKTSLLLKSSHEGIYEIRLGTLREEERNISEIISAFEITLDVKSLSLISGLHEERISECLTALQNKNIIQQLTLNFNPVFVTEGLKRFVYSKIQDKKEFHKNIVKLLKEKIPGFNRTELSRQYELSEEFFESYKVLKDEIAQAEKISAYSYQKKLLTHLLEIPLQDELKTEIKVELCNVLFRMSDFKSCIDLIEELGTKISSKEKLLELAALKGSCLIGLGDYQSGKDQLNSVIRQIDDNATRQQLLVDIANAEFELNKYSEASELCNKIIGDENASGLDKGKCHNFLGLIEIYRDNNLGGALLHFEEAEKIYQQSDLRLRVAQMEMNMGNIYNIKGDHDLAVTYWNKSLQMNQSIGNLDQEAKLLLNFGVFNFDKLDFEKAIEYYQRASSIFLTLGNKAGHALVQTNLGEINLIICEYQKAIAALTDAKNILEKIQNYNECLEAVFLICRVYYIIGDFVSLERQLKDFERIISSESVSDKHRDNFELMKILKLLPERQENENGLREKINKLAGVRDKYFKNEEKNNYFFSSVQTIKILIQLNDCQRAFSELHSETFVSFCKENNYFEAERLYLLGYLSAASDNRELKPAVDYYLSAYEIIKDLNITELTWKILFVLTVVYAERGNYARAGEFLNYAESVLGFIADKFTDPRLKMVYLDHPDRQAAINTLKRISEQI